MKILLLHLLPLLLERCLHLQVHIDAVLFRGVLHLSDAGNVGHCLTLLELEVVDQTLVLFVFPGGCRLL